MKKLFLFLLVGMLLSTWVSAAPQELIFTPGHIERQTQKVSGVEVNSIEDTFNDPGFSEQWGLFNPGFVNYYLLRANAVQFLPRVGVVIYDTGADVTNPDLAGIPSVSIDMTGIGNGDGFGHGTPVSTALAAQGGNAFGTVGATVNMPVTLIFVKVFDSEGRPATTDVLTPTIDWVLAHKTEFNIKVINFSVGAVAPRSADNPENRAQIQRLSDAGVGLIAGVGYDGIDIYHSDLTIYPAYWAGQIPGILAVTALTQKSALFNGSTRGPVDFGARVLGAPGEGIAATASGTHVIELWGGPSIAAPFVTASWALLAQMHPDWTPSQIEDQILTKADQIDVGEPLWGRLNFYKAATQTAKPVISNSSSVTRTKKFYNIILQGDEFGVYPQVLINGQVVKSQFITDLGKNSITIFGKKSKLHINGDGTDILLVRHSTGGESEPRVF